MRKIITKYRYNIILESGIQKHWTGIFKTKLLAWTWFENHGSFFEDLGFELILISSEKLGV